MIMCLKIKLKRYSWSDQVVSNQIIQTKMIKVRWINQFIGVFFDAFTKVRTIGQHPYRMAGCHLLTSVPGRIAVFTRMRKQRQRFLMRNNQSSSMRNVSFFLMRNQGRSSLSNHNLYLNTTSCQPLLMLHIWIWFYVTTTTAATPT